MSERAARHTHLDESPHGRGAERRPDRETERRLWFSLLAAPLAWTAAQLGAYVVAGRDCGVQGPGGVLDGWQWLAVLGIPAAAALVALAGLVVAVGVFRRWSGPVSITRAEGWNRVEFMSLVGAIVSVVLLLNIVFFGIMPLIVDPCLRVT